MNSSTGPNPATQADLPREEMLRQWLGVRTPEPSYYALLGVPELETDAKAILEAGRRVKRKVRAYQIGLYRKQALALLAEIGQAVSTLTNPEKKRDYDNRLMARWRKEAEDLAREHLGRGERTPQALEAWLTDCRVRGLPVARLMPYLMRRVMARAQAWPKVGVHALLLPAAVWMYRDAAVLGQCLAIGPLEKRAESVKRAQRMLGVPQGIARMVAEEVGRGIHLFAELRLVRQAKAHPEETLLRMSRRIRRYGGRVANGKVLAAVARLLGKKKADLDRALASLDGPTAETTPEGGSAAVAAVAARVRSLGDRMAEAAASAVKWIAKRPPFLVPIAVAAGLLCLLIAVLVLFDVLHLSGPEAPPAEDDAAVSEGRDAPTPAGSERAPSVRPPAEGSVEPPVWLKRFREKYPATRPPAPPEHPSAPKEEKKDPPSDVRFFGLRGEQREDGESAEQPMRNVK